MKNDLTKYVTDWFARGDDDLALVKLMLEKGTSSLNLACFHAQQAAEKYLKGFLAHHDLHVRKMHDLEVLLEDCKNVDSSFVELQDSARFLNQFYTESRYPDDYVEFSREDAEKAYGAALRIKDFVLAKITSSKPAGGFGTIGIFVVIAAVLVLAGGGYFAYQRFAKVPVSSTPQTTPTPPAGEIDTSEWKTYRNEKYGFEVKYPKDFSLNFPDSPAINITSYDLFDPRYERGNIEGLKIQGGVALQKFLNQQSALDDLNIPRDEFGVREYTVVQFGVYTIFRNIKWTQNYGNGFLEGVHLPSHAIYDPASGRLASFNIWDPSGKFAKEIDLILSTFKFIR